MFIHENEILWIIGGGLPGFYGPGRKFDETLASKHASLEIEFDVFQERADIAHYLQFTPFLYACADRRLEYLHSNQNLQLVSEKR